MLTNDDAVGKINIQSNYEGVSDPRADVAKVIAQALETPSTIKKDINFVTGDEDIVKAIR